jgi:alpha-galactosidase
MPKNAIFSYRTRQTEVDLFEDSHFWNRCEQITIDRYWNGKSALREKGYNWANLTHVRSLWNETSIFFLFQAFFDSLDVNPEWSTEAPTHGLWNKDVVELFLKPKAREDYYEIEVSPLGQWLDIHILEPHAQLDFQWSSRAQLKAALNNQERIWSVFLCLPCESMGDVFPEVGGAWRLNFCRIAGARPNREYLSWRPTFTEKPDFHAPASFGHIVFLDG